MHSSSKVHCTAIFRWKMFASMNKKMGGRILMLSLLLLARFCASAPPVQSQAADTEGKVGPTAIPIPLSGTLSGAAASPSAPPPTKAPQSGCFPRTARVKLADGSVKEMGTLEVGDIVRTGRGYSEVFMFSHRVDFGMYEFIELTTETGARIRLTSEHLLVVNSLLREAGSVRLDDVLTLSDGGDSRVILVRQVRDSGLYNPHTISGDIVVNSILTSTYTQNVPAKVAHAALMPLRAAWQRFAFYTNLLHDGAPWVPCFHNAPFTS